MDLQFRTSYFYQVRYFNPNMLPFSTALSDPKWFHEDKGNGHIWIDGRGVVNGLRCNLIIDKATAISHTDSSCPCPELGIRNTSADCSFLQAYRAALEELDFNELYESFTLVARHYWFKYSKLDHTKPLTIVLLVHEAVLNQCSERKPLQDYFLAHGIECKEWEGTVTPKAKSTAAARYLKYFMKKE